MTVSERAAGEPSTTEARPDEHQGGAAEVEVDEIGAADRHHGAIGRRVDALHERLDGIRGGRLALRVTVAIVGAVFVIAGIVMLVIPGPGWLTIFLGLAILGTEFAFARRVNDWLRDKVRRAWAWWKARRARRKGDPAA